MILLEKASGGRIVFRGQDIATLSASQRDYRQAVQAVFQDPYSSLNPRLTIAKRSVSSARDGADLSKAARRSASAKR